MLALNPARRTSPACPAAWSLVVEQCYVAALVPIMEASRSIRRQREGKAAVLVVQGIVKRVGYQTRIRAVLSRAAGDERRDGQGGFVDRGEVASGNRFEADVVEEHRAAVWGVDVVRYNSEQDMNVVEIGWAGIWHTRRRPQ